ncbi:MAG: hypothetical protein ACXVLT_09880, partial [Flavisolibacter sp.]
FLFTLSRNTSSRRVGSGWNYRINHLTLILLLQLLVISLFTLFIWLFSKKGCEFLLLSKRLKCASTWTKVIMYFWTAIALQNNKPGCSPTRG